MSPRRVDAGAAVAAVGAAMLLVSLFLDWYGDGDRGFTGWTVFEVVDLVLAALAIAAIASFLRRTGIDPRVPDAPLVALGLAALILTTSQLLNHPPAATDLDEEVGAWLAFAGSALLLAGALMSAARVSLTIDHRDRDRDPAAPPHAESETVKLDEPPPSA